MTDHFGKTWVRYFAALEAAIERCDADEADYRNNLIESLATMKQRAVRGGRAPSDDLRNIQLWDGRLC
jgi:hypothetical protein